MLDTFRKWLWNEQFWFSGKQTFEQIENSGYRRFNDIYYGVYTAVAWLAIRVVLERYAFVALGRWIGIADKPKQAPAPNSVLEKNFLKFGRKISKKEITGLAKQADLTEREVERWLRLRAQQDRPTIITKFAESASKFTIYTFLFVYGMVSMWNKPCLWDSKYCLVGYPAHYVSNDIWWHYNLEFGLYFGYFVTQFFDVKRKDFWTMFVHHFVTLGLLYHSWAVNLTLVGSLVMVIHDVADVVLEISKCLVYAKKDQYGPITFGLFTVVWVITRLVIFPYRIVYNNLYAALSYMPIIPGYWIQFAWFSTLQTLHIVWTYFIVRVAVNQRKSGGKLKDSRSDDEHEDDED